jgi:hypothetical protein
MMPHLAGKGEECQGGNDRKAEDLYVLSVLGFWILCSHCTVNDASQASHSFFPFSPACFFILVHVLVLLYFWMSDLIKKTSTILRGSSFAFAHIPQVKRIQNAAEKQWLAHVLQEQAKYTTVPELCIRTKKV